MSNPLLVQQALLETYALDKTTTIESIPARFDDSTHQVFKLKLHNNKAMAFKVLSNINNSFWHVMSDLFKISPSRDIAIITHAAEALFREHQTPIQAPKVMGHGVLAQTDQPFTYSNWVKGDSLQDFNDMQVEILATHLGALHSLKYAQFGGLTNPNLNDWGLMLARTLENAGCEDDDLLDDAENIAPLHFSPILLDLRPDQFIQTDHALMLIDLDALVIGDPQLELVLLESLLSKSQANVFQHYYPHPIEIKDVRLPYRHLLFYMNFLGETNLTIWLNKPLNFEE